MTRAATPAVALVTGASGVIGSAVAVMLHGRGYRIAVHGRNQRRLARTVSSCLDPGDAGAADSVLALTGDLTEEGVPEGLVDATVRRWGRLDLVVAAAGVFPKESLDSTDSGLWDSVIALNLTAPARMVRHALPALRAADPGVVILIGSEPVTRPIARPLQEAYYAAKGGVLGMARGLQASLQAEPIRTVVVHPDWTLPDAEVTDPSSQLPASRLAEAIGHVVDIAHLVTIRELTLYPTG